MGKLNLIKPFLMSALGMKGKGHESINRIYTKTCYKFSSYDVTDDRVYKYKTRPLPKIHSRPLPIKVTEC